nr:unnamed protein product [Digitaria exilis]
MMMGSGEEGEEGCAGGEATAMSSAASTGRGQEVVLHVYDVGRTGCDKTDRTVRNINRFFKDCIGVGGIFHTAVQVYGDEEWSFGFCYCGTGVFRCPTRQNPMYRYRESIVLGVTSFSEPEVNQILTELSFEWCGFSYDLLSRNCNHFTNEFCEKLGARKSPGWVNRFANVIYTANVFAGTTVLQAHSFDPKRELVPETAASISCFHQKGFLTRMWVPWMAFRSADATECTAADAILALICPRLGVCLAVLPPPLLHGAAEAAAAWLLIFFLSVEETISAQLCCCGFSVFVECLLWLREAR